MTLHGRIVQGGVTAPCRCICNSRVSHDASGDLRAGFTASTRLAQALELYARNVHVQIQTIEQRTGNAGAIALYLIGSAVTATVRVAEIATWTRVHRRDQLEARRKFRLAGRTGNRNGAEFQRFAKHFQDMPLEFRQFIEKQDAVVGQRNLSRPRVDTSADEGRRRGRVMRTAKWPCAPLARLQRTAAIERSAATSIASASFIGGTMPGNRCASMLFPAPGDPINNRLC